MVTAQVKTGLSTTFAIHLAPVDARNLIRDRIQEAVARVGEIASLTLQSPLVMEIVREEPWPVQIRAGAERVDAFTIRYTGDRFWGIFHDHFYGTPDLPLPK